MEGDGGLVGYLEVNLKGTDVNRTPDLIDIYGNEQFYLGRNASLCRRHWSDSTISNKHIRIHCILYEKDRISEIPPFVYATDVSTNGAFLKKSTTGYAGFHGEGEVLMGRNNGSFLLDDNDEIRISDNITLIYHDYGTATNHPLSPTQEREKELFASRYILTGRLLGKGGYGKVFVGLHRRTQRQVACKVVDLRKLCNGTTASKMQSPKAALQEGRTNDKGGLKRWPSKVVRCFREFDVISDISHPNIISIEKVFWSSNTIYIFEELVTGGDLFSYIEYKQGRLNDIEAAIIVRQILIGIQYLHNHGIVHRDLKPDNVLMTSLEDGARIVITDFGNARYLPQTHSGARSRSISKSRMFSLVGTLEYAAPEIHKRNPAIPADQGYSKSVDMWSIGAITAALLSGDVIFTNRRHPGYDTNPFEVIMSLAAQCDISVIDDQYDPAWRKVGNRPKDFIKKLLVLREQDRLTAAEALKHAWFSNPRHASEFETLYERSIKDWKPRKLADDIVEPIEVVSTLARPNAKTSSHIKPPFSQRLISNNNEYPSPSLHKTQYQSSPPLAEQYSKQNPYQHQSCHSESGASDCMPTRSQLNRPDGLGGLVKQPSVDSDPLASAMYSGHEAQSRYLYDGIASQVEVEDSQQSIDSRPPIRETQTDSLVIYETPVEVPSKRALSSDSQLPPCDNVCYVGNAKSRSAASKKRKLISDHD